MFNNRAPLLGTFFAFALLLAAGITRVVGSFGKGDVVSVVGSRGTEIARGLTNYPADELQRIQGLRSDRFLQVLGHCPYEEVIHRDNLVLLGPDGLHREQGRDE